jgi:DNA-binding CsgD family transcriptional regulator
VTSRSPERERFETLANREREVFALLAQGYTAPEIGARLGISAKTVYSYKARIAEKVGVSHRSQYVQVALRMGLLANPRAQAEPRQLPTAPQAQR